MRGKGNNQSRLMRIITMPIRVLSKAKDLYVKSMMECADSASYGNFMGVPGSIPRSFSASSSRSSSFDSSSNEDLRELIRSASASARTSLDRNNSNINIASNTRSSMSMDLYMMKQQQMRPSSGAMMMGSRRVPRSCSVGMGKIDEDTPCDFEDEDQHQHHLGTTSRKSSSSSSTEFMYPRSKSYAVAGRNVVF